MFEFVTGSWDVISGSQSPKSLFAIRRRLLRPAIEALGPLAGRKGCAPGHAGRVVRARTTWLAKAEFSRRNIEHVGNFLSPYLWVPFPVRGWGGGKKKNPTLAVGPRLLLADQEWAPRSNFWSIAPRCFPASRNVAKQADLRRKGKREGHGEKRTIPLFFRVETKSIFFHFKQEPAGRPFFGGQFLRRELLSH